MRTGVANLPLHYGCVPSWLFDRMKKLSREMIRIMVEEFGPVHFLRKLSDPFWFQALGCVLGYDWNSSGLTTVVCGALKEGLRGTERDLGIFVCGGKGTTSRKTPREIESFADSYGFDPQPLIYTSRMSAKVDNTALQDGYQLYHHSFFFANMQKGKKLDSYKTQDSVLKEKTVEWVVVQQGMNDANRMARRYHWLGSEVEDFVEEPEKAICCDKRGDTLNLVARESSEARKTSVVVVNQGVNLLLKDLEKVDKLDLPRRHFIKESDFNTPRLQKILIRAYEAHPDNFEGLLSQEGVGPKTIRALSLISELIYGKRPSYQDPARFSFAHGGKDGIPYPVERRTYDQSIMILKEVINQAKLGLTEKERALKRLGLFSL